MAQIENALIRAQLQERRQRLGAALPKTHSPEHLAGLIRQVDAALENLDRGTYGLCETCHDPIEPERLLANPLERFCLDHLTPDQQRALEQDLEMAALIQGRLLPPPACWPRPGTSPTCTRRPASSAATTATWWLPSQATGPCFSCWGTSPARAWPPRC